MPFSLVSKLSYKLVIKSVYFVSNYKAVKAGLLTPPNGPNGDLVDCSACDSVLCVEVLAGLAGECLPRPRLFL